MKNFAVALSLIATLVLSGACSPRKVNHNRKPLPNQFQGYWVSTEKYKEFKSGVQKSSCTDESDDSESAMTLFIDKDGAIYFYFLGFDSYSNKSDLQLGKADRLGSIKMDYFSKKDSKLYEYTIENTDKKTEINITFRFKKPEPGFEDFKYETPMKKVTKAQMDAFLTAQQCGEVFEKTDFSQVDDESVNDEDSSEESVIEESSEKSDKESKIEEKSDQNSSEPKVSRDSESENP